MVELAPGRRHLRALDGLRAAAILGVFAVHAGVHGLPGGGVGVEVFFSLSGFLITTLLLAEHDRSGRVDLGRFYGRRALRLLPALFALIAAVTVLTAAHQAPRGDYRAIPSLLFYYANWYKLAGGDTGLYGHLWSLSVEEQFYLVWPVVLLWLLRRDPGGRLALRVVAVSALVPFVLRLLIWRRPAQNDQVFYGTHLVADEILAGVLLALLLWRADAARREQLVRGLRVAVWPALAWLLIVVFALPDVTKRTAWTAFYMTAGRGLDALAGAALVGYLAVTFGSPLARGFAWRPAVGLGLISYAFYLWHVPVLYECTVHVHARHAVVVAVALLLSVAVALVSWYVVEQPMQRRLGPRVRRSDRAVSG